MTYLERENVQKRGENSYTALKKRDVSCSGFTVTSQKPSESKSVQVSDIVDCTNGNDSGCTIAETQEHSHSVTTSYTLTAGGGIEGVFEASATFGQDYTNESSTSLQEGFVRISIQSPYDTTRWTAANFETDYCIRTKGLLIRILHCYVVQRDVHRLRFWRF